MKFGVFCYAKQKNVSQEMPDGSGDVLTWTTDGHKAYLIAVQNAFDNDIDFAQLVKMYDGSEGTNVQEKKYSPAVCTGCKKTKICGDPNPKLVSTSYVERENLTMRMHIEDIANLATIEAPIKRGHYKAKRVNLI